MLCMTGDWAAIRTDNPADKAYLKKLRKRCEAEGRTATKAETNKWAWTHWLDVLFYAAIIYVLVYTMTNIGRLQSYDIAVMKPVMADNKGRTASVFAAGTGIAMFCMYFFSATMNPVPFYSFAALAQFFFCGFNTAIYAIVPDCVEYGEWKTGIRNDGFQYALEHSRPNAFTDANLQPANRFNSWSMNTSISTITNALI